MSVESELARLQAARTAMVNAVNSKGVALASGATLSQIAVAIGLISGEGEPEPPVFSGVALQAANLNDVSYYGNTYPFIDMMKISGNEAWSADDGWVYGLAPGASVSTAIALDLDTVYGYFPPGDYKVRSTSAATLSVAGTGLSGITSGVGSCLFTVDVQSSGIYSGTTIRAYVTNDTGAPINVTNWQVYRVEYETLLDGGEIFSPVFLADVAGCALLRVMDWVHVNNSTTVRQSQLPQRSHRTYAVGVPYAICAELAAKTNRPVWVCLPAITDGFNFTTHAESNTIQTGRPDDGVVPHGWSNGQPIAFYDTNAPVPAPLVHGVTYYARNVTAATAQLSATVDGAILDLLAVEDSYGRVTGVYDPMPLYRAIAQEMAVANASARVIVECSNEIWNWGFDHYHHFRDIISREAGVLHDVPGAAAYRSFQCWKAFEEYFPRNQITRMIAWHTMNPMEALFEYVDPGVLTAGQATWQLMDQYSHAPYFSPALETADALIAANAATQNDAWWTALFDDNITLMGERTVLSMNMARSYRADMPITSYECGQHLFNRVYDWTPAHAALNTRFQEFINSTAGVALYQDYYDRVFVPGELLHFNHYVHSSRLYGNLYIGGWGMKRAHDVPDTPRMTWFKSIPSTAT